MAPRNTDHWACPHSFWFNRSGMDQELASWQVCINANAAGPGATRWEPLAWSPTSVSQARGSPHMESKWNYKVKNSMHSQLSSGNWEGWQDKLFLGNCPEWFFSVIGGYLFHRAVLASALQQCESATSIHVSLPHTPSHPPCHHRPRICSVSDRP